MFLSSVQSLSHVRLFAIPWIAACQASLSITNSRSPPNSCPLSLWWHRTISSSVVTFSCAQSFPALGASQISQLFASSGQGWSFSFNISPSNEHPGLISFSMDWLDLLAVQGTLKNLLQYQSSKTSVLQCSAFSLVQISHPYMTTGETIALTLWTFVSKVMPLFLTCHLSLSKLLFQGASIF